MLFPFEYFRNISGTRWLHWQYRKHVQGQCRRHMMAEILRYRGADDAVFDAAKFRRASGLRADTRVLSTITTSRMRWLRCSTRQWDDALLVTADAGGDTVNYSHRVFADGKLTTIYGGEECRFVPQPVDSVGEAYMAMTAALGFIPLRHEGKLTGLAAFGQPALAERIGRRFSSTRRAACSRILPASPRCTASSARSPPR